jgi:hypothetical protein
MAWWRFGKDKAPENTEPEPSPKDDLVARVYAFLSDDELQNRKLSDWLRGEISRAPSVDQVAGGSGEFGRDRNNPIPVNGPFGEAQYLSSLVTDAGQPIAFQRLGGDGRIDLFETVTFDGREWDILYLTKFFPRKSHTAPKGFRFATRDERPALIRGVVDQAEDFPFATFARAAKFTARVVGVSIADPRLKAFDDLKYRIPEEHIRLLERVRFGARARTEEGAG